MKHHPQKKVNTTKKSVVKTLNFTKGIPDQLQNTYYQYSTSDSSNESDQLSELMIKSNEILLNDLTSGQEIDYLSDVSYRRLKKNTYVLYNGNLFQKIHLLDNHDLELFDDSNDYQTALKILDKQLYHSGSLPDDLRASPKDLDGKYYVNSLDFRNYISFNTGIRNSYEAIVQSNGLLQFSRYFHPEILIKNGKYALKTLDLSDASAEHYVTFSRVSATCLKDDTTNQLYYLEKNPKQQALKKMGIEEPITKYYQKSNSKIESKTYDFADDQDDDYYDTYDDFNLNEGD
ncbi:hypothetical protein FC88_GL000074 [Companilactobacillus futsaii JCM 17355]|uniref:Uncharacterized protein n=1 Tax=Companilactobacillus futsaii JCM 17355 TaxID=1423818 RepID=A0ABR5P916_9LACO|nr:hypothetical protein FC88_GL000074 [Companilactobacillus futsaii JCM 17355]